MPTTRTDNTFQEALMKMLRSLADMKVLPDADLEWVLGVEMQVVQKRNEAPMPNPDELRRLLTQG